MQDFKMSGSNMNELLTNMKAIKEQQLRGEICLEEQDNMLLHLTEVP